MSKHVPVLDDEGRCCIGSDGVGQCEPGTCACGPDLHLTVVVDDEPTPAGPPDDSGETPVEANRERLRAAGDKIREMRGLGPDDDLPDLRTWTREEVMAARAVAYPEIYDDESGDESA